MHINDNPCSFEEDCAFSLRGPLANRCYLKCKSAELISRVPSQCASNIHPLPRRRLRSDTDLPAQREKNARIAMQGPMVIEEGTVHASSSHRDRPKAAPDEVGGNVISLSEERERRRQLQRNQQREQIALLSRTFSAWLLFTQLGKLKQKHELVADAFRYRRLISKAYKSWKLTFRNQVYNANAVSEVILLKFEARRQQNLKRRAFKLWVNYVQLCRKKSNFAFQAQKFRRRKVLSRYLYIWRRKKDEKIIDQDILISRYQLRWQHLKRVSLLKKSLHHWSLFVCLQRQKRDVNAIFLSVQRQRTLKYFNTWRVSYNHIEQQRIAKAEKFFESRYLVALDNRIVSTAFQAWKNYCHGRLEKKQGRVIAEKHSKASKLRYFLNVWKSNYLEQIERKFKLAQEFYRDILARKNSKLKSVCFEALLNYKNKSCHRKAFIRSAINFDIQRLLHLCYFTWKRNWSYRTQENYQTCLALLHWSTSLKRRALIGWRQASIRSRDERVKFAAAVLATRETLQREYIQSGIFHANSILCRSGNEFLTSCKSKYPLVVYNCAQIWLRKWRRNKFFRSKLDEAVHGKDSVLDILETNSEWKSFEFELSDHLSEPLPELVLNYIKEKALDDYKFRSLPVNRKSLLYVTQSLNRIESKTPMEPMLLTATSRQCQEDTVRSSERVDCAQNGTQADNWVLNSVPDGLERQETDVDQTAPKKPDGFVDDTDNLSSNAQNTFEVDSPHMADKINLDETHSGNENGNTFDEDPAAHTFTVDNNLEDLDDSQQPRCPDFMRMSIEKMGIKVGLFSTSQNTSKLDGTDDYTNLSDIRERTKELNGSPFEDQTSFRGGKRDFAERVTQNQLSGEGSDDDDSDKPNGVAEQTFDGQTSQEEDLNLRASVIIDSHLLMRPEDFSDALPSSTPNESLDTISNRVTAHGDQLVADLPSLLNENVTKYTDTLTETILKEVVDQIDSVPETETKLESSRGLNHVEISTQTDLSFFHSGSENLADRSLGRKNLEPQFCHNCHRNLTSQHMENNLETEMTMGQTSELELRNCSPQLTNSKYSIELKRLVVKYKSLKSKAEKKQTALKSLISDITNGVKNLDECETKRVIELKSEIRSLNRQLRDLKVAIKSVEK